VDGDGAVSATPVNPAEEQSGRMFTATAALPYEHLERATAGLRAERRRQVLAGDVRELPRWETFVVTGPSEFTDLRGRTWYEYRAAVQSRHPPEGTRSALARAPLGAC
jgi:hypothetical protein